MELFQPTYCWWKKSCTTWDNLPINWCRILSINSITGFWAHLSWLWSNLDQLRQDGLLDLTELHTGRLLGSLARSSSWWQLAPWKYSITLVGSRWAWPNKTKLWGPGFYEPSSCKGYNSPGKKQMYFRPLWRTQPFITGADLVAETMSFVSFWGDIGFYRQVFFFLC